MRENGLHFAVAIVALAALGALPPLTPERLRASSDAIVVGELVDFSSEEKQRGKGVIDTVFAMRLRVRAVEKSPDDPAPPRPGELITVHGSNLARAPEGWTGPSGHYTVDYKMSLRKVLELSRTTRIEARFYLAVHKGNYSLLQPNGLELISASKR